MVTEIIHRTASRSLARSPHAHFLRLISRSKNALRAFVLAVAFAEIVRLLPQDLRPDLGVVGEFAVIFAVAWMAIVATGVVVEVVAARFDTSVADNRRARSVQTQLRVMRRVTIVAIVIIAVLAALTSTSMGRGVAASVLASAGVIGLVAGIAGQSTIGNLIAGVQVAFSDGLRIDDVVVVDGDWGTIEEITLTFVVVKIWDERRLVLPVSFFVQNAFENWTRHDARILGTVMLYADYTVSVDDVRAEFLAFVGAHKLWDHRAAALQVVDMTEHTMVLRAVVSASSASESWDLRCDVREHLVAFLARASRRLPTTRLELGGPIPDGLAARDGTDDDEGH